MADRVTILVSADLAEALDRFMAADAQQSHSRQDAFRHIVCTRLTREGYMTIQDGASTRPPERQNDHRTGRTSPERCCRDPPCFPGLVRRLTSLIVEHQWDAREYR
jgi:hypothetical protein